LVPGEYSAGWPVPFTVLPQVTNHAGPVHIEVFYGDVEAIGAGEHTTHTYAEPGLYQWKVVSHLAAQSVTNTGMIQITQPIVLNARFDGSMVNLSWPVGVADVVLESSPTLGQGASWSWVTNATQTAGGKVSVSLANSGMLYFRIRKPW
jgi:hypothetical protein